MFDLNFSYSSKLADNIVRTIGFFSSKAKQKYVQYNKKVSSMKGEKDSRYIYIAITL